MTCEPSNVRRDSFDSAAEAYDRGRPDYPEELVVDLIAHAGIGEGARVLEIGPGTGQLSVPLAASGATLVAVERGEHLAEIARRKLSRFEHAEVVVADFDRWECAPASFDVIVAATSFHWLDPNTRVAKCAELLRSGGALAIVQTTWGVAHGDDPFFSASQRCYAQWDLSHDPTYRQPASDDVLPPSIDAVDMFEDVFRRRYLQRREYRTAAYCELLGTFSDLLAMEEKRRNGFLECVSRLIDSQFDGRIVRHDLYDLVIARRLPEEPCLNAHRTMANLPSSPSAVERTR
jgi:SAM-dependent methyltransferase